MENAQVIEVNGVCIPVDMLRVKERPLKTDYDRPALTCKRRNNIEEKALTTSEYLEAIEKDQQQEGICPATDLEMHEQLAELYKDFNSEKIKDFVRRYSLTSGVEDGLANSFSNIFTLIPAVDEFGTDITAEIKTNRLISSGIAGELSEYLESSHPVPSMDISKFILQLEDMLLCVQQMSQLDKNAFSLMLMNIASNLIETKRSSR